MCESHVLFHLPFQLPSVCNTSVFDNVEATRLRNLCRVMAVRLPIINNNRSRGFRDSAKSRRRFHCIKARDARRLIFADTNHALKDRSSDRSIDRERVR